ncbi:MAG: DNA polymerase Y family protein [Gammaproteobacteria bacterium]
MLWLALSLPQLPLESSIVGVESGCVDPGVPRVIYESYGLQQTVYSLNAAAINTGVEVGMSLGSARSLCSHLHAVERSPANELSALNGLALWAQQFTSQVSLQPPDGLLLEVGASLSLFSGLGKLQRAVLSGLGKLGYSADVGVAPTPGAAWLLALDGNSEAVTQHEKLARTLFPLSLNLLPLSVEKKAALKRLGLKTIADCLRLPRDGIARRMGPQLLCYLDRALGLLPEPREYYVAPDYFQSQVLLPEPVFQVQPLLFGLKRLLRELCGFLQARDAGAQQLLLGFIAPSQSSSQARDPLVLNLLHPARDVDHLFKLWQEKLERHTLRESVEGLELQVKQLVPLAPVPPDLFSRKQGPDTDFIQILERLKNRLGENVIHQVICHADYRAEHANKQIVFPNCNQQAMGDSFAYRPCWLLKHPRLLAQSAGVPCLYGPLDLLSGPERIESGWWDSHDQSRDYYIARSRTQQKLWVYRDLNCDLNGSSQWYLHGFFA